ncbi:hypothetical protein QLX67_06200 [Balneolaceae bacterium ANBcel3]|nr:hypothetical protein [Balneolaceae bacterium ANBcel3]
MLDSLITSKTRLRLLFYFFANSRNRGWLRGLATEFSESTNAVRLELNRLTEAGLLLYEDTGNKRMYRANRQHALYTDLKNITRKQLGLDHIFHLVNQSVGNILWAMVTGEYAKGNDTGVVDCIVVGNVDKNRLKKRARQKEKIIQRRIRLLILTQEEYDMLEPSLNVGKALLLIGDPEKECLEEVQ